MDADAVRGRRHAHHAQRELHGWRFTFPTYDHPHTYSITAWAVDRNGNPDPTRAVVSRICVRDVGGTCP